MSLKYEINDLFESITYSAYLVLVERLRYENSKLREELKRLQ